MNTTESNLIFFNGIDGETGEPLLRPLTVKEVADAALEPEQEWVSRAELERNRHQREQHYGFAGDADDLAQTGWGIVLPEDHPQEWKTALEPLIAHRTGQMGKHPEYCRCLTYKQGETLHSFRTRYGVSPGDAHPKYSFPYYLMIVGDPAQIPWEFQYALDVDYAVGRLHFDGSGATAALERYARNVVACETAAPRPPTVTLFGVRNEHDRATQLSAELLVKPLASALLDEWDNWTTEVVLEQSATKDRLGQLLDGRQTPALLLTASHGIRLRHNHPQLRERQGALVCQKLTGKKGEDVTFAAANLAPEVNLNGLIALNFACFSAGSPAVDDVLYRWGKWQTVEPPFVARLPQQMLKQGALAVIAHVGAATSYSFDWPETQGHYRNLLGVLLRLRNGFPVGHAMESINSLYTSCAIALDDERKNARAEKRDDPLLARYWTGKMDARGFVVLGDPAVRLTTSAAKQGD